MSLFHFKQFTITQSRSALKVGTDAMILGSVIDPGTYENGLDIGAGTGVLSLMVAQENPILHIDAIELDEGSFLDCKDNFASSNWKERLSAIHGDFLSFKNEKKYDLIFSNPPFYKDGLLSPDKRVSQSKHATDLSLEKLIEKSAEMLTEEGRFWLIFPFDLSEVIGQYAKNSGLSVQKRIRIEGKPGRPTRTIVCLGFEPLSTHESMIVIRTEENTYSSQYSQLTKAFHGKEIT
jgi:tRNA1Val (adenine37-N6)-methyltransferase